MIHIVYERAIQASPRAAEELVAVPLAPRRAGAQGPRRARGALAARAIGTKEMGSFL